MRQQLDQFEELSSKQASSPKSLSAPSSGIGLVLRDETSRRGMDFLGGMASLLFLAPLMLLISAVVYAETGKVLFRQRKTGFKGRVFSAYKFRTLYLPGIDMAATRLGKGDTRITRSGGFLRALGLDELPQLLNVVKGDMSFTRDRTATN